MPATSGSATAVNTIGVGTIGVSSTKDTMSLFMFLGDIALAKDFASDRAD